MGPFANCTGVNSSDLAHKLPFNVHMQRISSHPLPQAGTFSTVPGGLQGLSSLGSAPGPCTGTRPPQRSSCPSQASPTSRGAQRQQHQHLQGGRGTTGDRRSCSSPAGTLWGAQHQGQGDPGRSRCSSLVPQLLVLKLQGRALLPALPCSSCAHTWCALQELWVVPPCALQHHRVTQRS